MTPYQHLYPIAFLFIAQTVTAQEVTLLADEWCPYTCLPDTDKPGILVEVGEKIFADSPAKFNFQLLNWSRAVKDVRVGKSQGLLGAYISDAPDFIFHSRPILFSQMCFYSKSDEDWEFTGFDSLSKRVISVINGYSYGEEFDRYMLKHPRNIINIAGDKLLERELLMLQKKRINTILEDRFVFGQKAKQFGLESKGCLAKEGVYIAFSPADELRSKVLADWVDKQMAKLRTQGEIELILKKYLD